MCSKRERYTTMLQESLQIIREVHLLGFFLLCVMGCNNKGNLLALRIYSISGGKEVSGTVTKNMTS